jgi:hypothetical protein
MLAMQTYVLWVCRYGIFLCGQCRVSLSKCRILYGLCEECVARMCGGVGCQRGFKSPLRHLAVGSERKTNT